MSKYIFLLLVVVVLLFSVHTTVSAVGANSSFGVRTLVGEDTTPPSTPTLQRVTPLSSSQINIVWDVATDDYLLAGYRLFRGGVQIATTTQTTFTDTGLNPQTLYAYTVQAYDSSDNISSSSALIATTTLAIVVPPATSSVPVTTPKNPPGILTTLLQSFNISVKERSATVEWQTNTSVRYTISWGRTTTYELGTVSTNIFKQAHETTLDNLEPGTHYWYSILVENTIGVTQILKAGEFVTVPVFNSVAPTNVRNVQVSVEADDVTLAWVNPELSEGAKVRVVRNYLFYPQSATDGALVYEGDGTTALDTAALRERSSQYYAIFVIDADGAVSSGAVAIASKNPIPIVVASSTHPSASSSVSVPDSILDESGDASVLHADAVFVRQGLTVQVFSDGIKLDANIPYTVFIPVEAVSVHLKSILVSIKDPTDQRIVTTYLLKLNKAGDAYVADIDPPHVIGVAGLSVEVFDFYQASVRRLTAPITFITPQSPAVAFPDNIVFLARAYGYAALETIVALGFFWWFILWRRRRREDKS